MNNNLQKSIHRRILTDMDDIDFAADLDRAMKNHGNGVGISQADLFRLSKVPQPTISRILKGKHTPETATIMKLRQVLPDFAAKYIPSKLPLITDASVIEYVSALPPARRNAIANYILSLDSDPPPATGDPPPLQRRLRGKPGPRQVAKQVIQA